MDYDLEEEIYDCDNSSEEGVCTLFISKHLVPKITTRKRNRCKAKWISIGNFAGMAEVLKFKGNHLKSTGIVRDSCVFLHVEEIGYLMQQEALIIHHGDNGDLFLTIMDIYSHLLTGQYGCTWEAFKVYSELKTLGYIVGRHGVLWSNSSKSSRIWESSHEKSSDEVSSSFERLQVMDKSCIVHGKDYVEEDANSLLNSKATIGCKVQPMATHQCLNSDNSSEVLTRNVDLMFDVFPPNSRFKKTIPGNPDFSLYVSSNLPPDMAVMEALKTRSKNIPVTIATVDSGRVSFFHFNEVQLPILP